MNRFPDFVRNNMAVSGSSVTCLPVQFDGGDWESSIFFAAGGSECKEDRRILNKLDGTISVAIDADVIEHNNAAVVVLRLEAFTRELDPLTGEVLLTPGEIESHFQTMKLLSKQPYLKWFFSDAAYYVIHSQQNPLGKVEHESFQEVLDKAVRHDALTRMTGQYDVGSAMNEVLSNYALR